MYAHITQWKAVKAAALRKEVGAAKHDNIKAKQLQAEHDLSDTLSAGNRVKVTMRELLKFGPVQEWLLVLAECSVDDGTVEQEAIEMIDDGSGEMISGLEFNVRHTTRHRKIVKSESQTNIEWSYKDGQIVPLGYTDIGKDASYQRIIKARKYHGIEDIVLTSKGTVKVGQGKGKRMTPRERNKMIRLQREAALAKRNAK